MKNSRTYRVISRDISHLLSLMHKMTAAKLRASLIMITYTICTIIERRDRSVKAITSRKHRTISSVLNRSWSPLKLASPEWSQKLVHPHSLMKETSMECLAAAHLWTSTRSSLVDSVLSTWRQRPRDLPKIAIHSCNNTDSNSLCKMATNKLAYRLLKQLGRSWWSKKVHRKQTLSTIIWLKALYWRLLTVELLSMTKKME